MQSIYGVESTQLTAYATLRPFRWMDIGGQIGWTNPDVTHVEGPFAALNEQTTFVPTEVSLTIDTRDFPVIRPAAWCCAASALATTTARPDAARFNRYEGEAASFVPIGGGRVVLAAARLAMCDRTRATGQSVPFYLQPSLGGVNTLRSFTDYRFRDDNMLVANAEAAPGADDASRSRGVRRCGQRRARARSDLDLGEAILWRRASVCIRAARPSR